MNDNKKLKEENKVKKKLNFRAIWNDKRMRSILIATAVIILCAILYLVLLFTVLKPEEAEPLPTIGNHGEQMSNGRPFVVDPISAEQIVSIKVDNDKGGFHY